MKNGRRIALLSALAFLVAAPWALAADPRDIVFECPCSAVWQAGADGQGKLVVSFGVRSFRATDSGEIHLQLPALSNNGWRYDYGKSTVGTLPGNGLVEGRRGISSREGPRPSDEVIRIELRESTDRSSSQSSYKHEELTLWRVGSADDSRRIRYVDLLTDEDGDGVGDVNEGIAGTNPDDPASRPGESTVDILWLFDDGAPQNAVYARIHHLKAVVNMIYADSRTNISLRTVGIRRIEKANKSGWADRKHVTQMMDLHGADVSQQVGSSLTPCRAAGCAGVGSSGNRGLWRYQSSWARNNASPIVVAHELGHVMGLVHSARQGETLGAFRWSRGHFLNRWLGRNSSSYLPIPVLVGTIMSYGADTPSQSFSDPAADCNGEPCGVPSTEANGADARTSLDLLRFQVAAHRDAMQDSDGDGFVDNADVAPDDPREWMDNDGDGLGDNADPDDDGDGVDDTKDRWPFDPREWEDLDGDGVGDNADDAVEVQGSLDPFRDAALRRAVEQELGKSPGDSISAEEMAGLRSLGATNPDIRDLTGLELATGLTALYINPSSGWNEVTDLSPLAGLTNLGILSLSDNDVSDLSPIAGLTQLESLEVRSALVTDLLPLAGLTNLEFLRIDSNQISDLSPLAGLTNLESLSLSYNRIVDLSPLSGLAGLVDLRLVWNRISDVAPLSGLSSLQTLDLQENRISNVALLSELRTLKELLLTGNSISDLSPLQGLANLEVLGLGQNQATDLSPLSGLMRLQDLRLDSNRITDLSPLAGLSALRRLWLDSNDVSDLSPLAGLALRDLDVGRTNVSLYDVVALPNFRDIRSLGVDGLGISDVRPLAALSQLEQLSLDGNLVSDVAPLAVPEIWSAGRSYLNLTGNPLDQVSVTKHVPLLESRGVVVFHEEMPAIEMPDARLRSLVAQATAGGQIYVDVGAPTRRRMELLRWLRAFNAGVSDLTGLETAINLSSADLGSNAVSDLAPLSKLDTLRDLNLNDNLVSDVLPLLNMDALQRVDLSGNPLTEESLNDHIPRLRETNVRVFVDSVKWGVIAGRDKTTFDTRAYFESLLGPALSYEVEDDSVLTGVDVVGGVLEVSPRVAVEELTAIVTATNGDGKQATLQFRVWLDAITESAANLQSGAQVQGVIDAPRYADYYRLTLESLSELTVWTSGDTDTYGRLYDADLSRIVRNNDSGAGANFRISTLLGAGTYYVEVSGNEGAAGAYSLAVETEPVPDLALDTPVAAAIDAGDDSDYFRLIVDTTTVVTVFTEGGTDTFGRLLNEHRSVLGLDHDRGDGSNFRIAHQLRAGTYYVEVSGWNGATGDYTVVVETGQDHGDERASATRLTLGESIQGVISPDDDVDVFGFTLDTPTIVAIRTEGGTAITAVVVDTAGRVFGTSGGCDPKVDIDACLSDFRFEGLLPAGDFYVVVGGRLMLGSVLADQYTVTVTVPEAQPRELAPGARIADEIESAVDVDYFSLSLDTASTVTLSLEDAAPLIIGRVFDGDGALIGRNGLEDGIIFGRLEDGDYLSVPIELPAGDYYVEVSGFRGATGAYSVAVEARPDHGNTSAAATDLPFGARVTGTVNPATIGDPVEGQEGVSREFVDDADYFRLTLDAVSAVSVSVESETSPIAQLFDGNGTLLWLYDEPFTNYRVENLLPAGTYYLELSGHDDAGEYVLAAEIEAIRELALGSRLGDTIDSVFDTDYFRLTVRSPAIVAVQIETGSLAQSAGRLLREDGSVIASGYGGNGSSIRMERELGPGTYFVEVRGVIDDETLNFDGPYTVGAESAPVPLLATGARVEDQIGSAGERDYFRLTVDTPTVVTVWSEGDTDTYGRLLDAGGTGISDDNDSGNATNFRITATLFPGTYFLDVSGHKGTETGNYALALETAPVPDLAVGARIEGSFNRTGEMDLYRLSVATSSMMSIWTEGGTDTSGRLLDANGAEIARDDDSGSNLNFRMERMLFPGTYFLEVRGIRDVGDYVTGDYVAAADAVPSTNLAIGAAEPGEIIAADDADWFRLALSEAAPVAIYTTGNLDTEGRLYDESGTRIASDDDGGIGRNFEIESHRPAGVYYIQVEAFGSDTGRYTLHARRYVDVALEGNWPARLWATPDGGWTLDRVTDKPFASGDRITAINGVTFVLTLGPDGVWTASAAPAVGSCEAGLDWTIRTVAGTGDGGYSGDGGPAAEARLNQPGAVAVDAAGNIYVADSDNHRIRRVAPDGTITSIAGAGVEGYGGDGGPATQAQLANPLGVAVDAAGNVYVADSGNHRIRRIAPDGTIASIAGTGVAGFGGDGGAATEARLGYPRSVVVDAAGNVYIADWSNYRVRRIAPDQTIDTVAGTGEFGNSGDGGPAPQARISNPWGLAVDTAGYVYFADFHNDRVRRIRPDGMIEAFAGTDDRGPSIGDGEPATEAWLDRPRGLAVDAAGYVYVADSQNHRIRRIAPDGIIQTIADMHPGFFAIIDPLSGPTGLAVDASGQHVHFTEPSNHRIRVVERSDDHGDEAACATPLTLGVALPGRIEASDDEDWFRLDLSDAASVAIFTTGALDTEGSLRDPSNVQIALDNDSGADTNFHIERQLQVGGYYMRVNSNGSATGEYTLHARRFVDVALRGSGSETVRLWGTAGDGWTLDRDTDVPFASGGEVAASDGARFELTLGSDGLWTASPAVELCEASLGGTIRTLGGTAGTLGFSGDGGFAVDARLYAPFDVAVDVAGYVFVAERGNHRIRMIGPDGIISTFAGTGVQGFSGDGGQATAAQFDRPIGLAVDASGIVYVADRLNHRVRRIGTDGIIATFAGTGTDGESGDGGPATAARLDEPTGVAVDSAGNVYVADSQNHRIRRIGLSGTIETFAGTGSFGHAGDGGPATAARLTYPFDVAVDSSGVVYVADTINHRIRRIGTDATITTIAGTGAEGYGGDGGPATAAQLDSPSGVAVNSAGYVFVADWGNHRIRRIAPDGTIVTFAGTGMDGLGGDGGPAVAAQLYSPSGVTVDAQGRVYIADQSSHRLRVVDLAEGCR